MCYFWFLRCSLGWNSREFRNFFCKRYSKITFFVIIVQIYSDSLTSGTYQISGVKVSPWELQLLSEAMGFQVEFSLRDLRRKPGFCPFLFLGPLGNRPKKHPNKISLATGGCGPTRARRNWRWAAGGRWFVSLKRIVHLKIDGQKPTKGNESCLPHFFNGYMLILGRVVVKLAKNGARCHVIHVCVCVFHKELVRAQETSKPQIEKKEEWA